MQITTTKMTTQTHFLDKKKNADTIIKRYTLIAAGTGFIPIPFIDAVAMAGVQFAMIRQIALLYKTPFKKHRVKAISAAFMGSIGTVSGFKFIPKIGTVLGGLSSSTIGAASTYAIGQVFAQHFDQGGTLLNFDPTASRIHFDRELEKGKEVIAQLRAEAALKTPEGRRQMIHQLKTDSDQYLTILTELLATIEQYKIDQFPKHSIVVNSLHPTIAENNINLEEVATVENRIASTGLSANENSINREIVAVVTVEKLKWWIRLKYWLIQRKR